MVESMAVSRELSKENTVAYMRTSNEAIHAVDPFHNKPNLMSNNKHENKCRNCDRPCDTGRYTSRNETCHKCPNTGHFAKCCHKKDKKQSYKQPSSFSGPNKTSANQSSHKLRPVVKFHMVNKQGDYEGDVHWDVVENSIRPINYTDSVDLVCSPNFEHLTRSTIDPPKIIEETQEINSI